MGTGSGVYIYSPRGPQAGKSKFFQLFACGRLAKKTSTIETIINSKL